MMDTLLQAETHQEILRQDPVLAEMVRRLVTEFRPSRVYLFGSRARNEATEDSDYDLLAIVADSELSFKERMLKAYGLMSGLGVSKDVVVMTQHEFQRKLPVVCSLPATVAREGKLLYAA